MKTFFLCAYGIVGLIALIILLSIFIWYCWRSVKDSIEEDAWYAERRKRDLHG